MTNYFWHIFGISTVLKVLLIPSYHSTDFEVHRNWLAITHSLPLNRWYVDATSEWTLDYPPFFAYFEWLLSQVAKYVDPRMLDVNNLNYASTETVYFQRFSVISTDIVYALGVRSCLKALGIGQQGHVTGALILLLNVGLIFVDHIHFQYNGLLFGLLLLSTSAMLNRRYLLGAFMFALLINFKHIFIYIAPAFAVHLLRFYCLNRDGNGKGNRNGGVMYCLNRDGNGKGIGGVMNCVKATIKLLVVGLTPFAIALGPFWNQLPQLVSRLFPFKRGLTHAYWAPNFWALYNAADKVLAIGLNRTGGGSAAGTGGGGAGGSTTSGLVHEVQHVVLPQVTPAITFLLTLIFMLPILLKLLQTQSESQGRLLFLRAVVLCGCSSFVFGWHVHEKAILMPLIPLCLLALMNAKDAKYAFMMSVIGHFALFPLLFEAQLLVVRYCLYLTYISMMCTQLRRLHKANAHLNALEWTYVLGFVGLPLYEHVVSPMFGLNIRLPFMPLLMTSVYAAVGVLYCFMGYYWYALNSSQGQTKTFITKKRKFK